MNQPVPPQGAVETRKSGKAAVEVDVDAWRHRIRAYTFGNYHYEMGVALEREGNLAAAAGAYDRAIAADPSLAAARLRLVEALTALGDSARAQEVETRFLTADPHFRTAAAYRRAKELAEAGQVDEAAALLETVDQQASAPLSDQLEAWRSVAGALAARKDFARAGQFLQHALAADPENAEALLGMANVAFRTNRTALAVDLARQSVETARQPRSLYLLGIYQLASGAAAPAIEAFAAARDAGYVPAGLCTLHIAWADTIAGRPAEAVAAFDTILTTEPHNVLAASYRAISLLALGRHEQALTAATAARSIAPDNSHAKTNHALCLAAVGRVDEARVLLDEAMAAAPNMAWSRYAAALLAARGGEVDRARAWVAEGRRLEPQWTAYFIGLLPGARESLLPLTTGL